MNIDWNKYFDHIYIISKSTNNSRREKLLPELNRVDLDNFKWYYTFENKLLQVPHTENYYNPNNTTYKQVKFSHYSLIKTCYELGYNDILIFEDDIRFLKDISQIQKILDDFENKKSNIDIYLFDYYNDNNDKFMYYFADCYYLNRKAMEYVIYMMENYEFVIDEIWFYNFDFSYIFWNRSPEYDPIYIDFLEKFRTLKIGVPEDIHLCIQQDTKEKINSCNKNIDKKLYNIEIL